MSAEQRSGPRPPCTTMGCDGMATHKALIYDDDILNGDWHPYCWDCAESVSDDETPAVELIFVDEPDPFDPDELVKWAITYGHPEEWAKRAQAADAKREKAEKDYRELRVWLMHTVGSASTLRQAQKIVERLIGNALAANSRHIEALRDCRCSMGVTAYDCPEHGE